MKLSEVIKAIEDGSKSEFISGFLTLRKCEVMSAVEFHIKSLKTLAIGFDDWQEVKPPRQWSEKELMLFKLLPEWAKWISKDRHSVYVSQNKPVKLEQQKTFSNIEGGMCHSIEIFDFLTITFEESPVYIGDLKGE